MATKPHGRMRTFFREVRIEMRKVTWPPRKELIKSTGVVIVAVIIAAVFIGVFDFIWNLVVQVGEFGVVVTEPDNQHGDPWMPSGT